MKKAIIIGVACLTAGIGLAGCGASSTTTETATTETMTTAESTTAETTTTTIDTTTAEPTTTTSVSTTEAPVVYDNNNPPEAYKKIISERYNEFKGVCSDGTNDQTNGVALGSSFIHCGSEISYCIHDINDDEIPELMLLSDEYIHELYTLHDGNAVMLWEGGYRSSLWIDEERTICQFGSGGAAVHGYEKNYLPKNGAALALIFRVEEDWGDYSKITPADDYDPFIAPDKIITEKITSEEYEKYINQFDEKNSTFPYEATFLKDFSNNVASGTYNDSTDVTPVKLAQDLYNRCRIVDGVAYDPEDDRDIYTKYAIADFDADGLNEIAIEVKHTGHNKYYGSADWTDIIIYKNAINRENEYKKIWYGSFDNTTFYDNGVAEYYNTDESLANNYLLFVSENGEIIDNRRFVILNDEMYGKLNYSMDNVKDEYTPVLTYFKDGGVIHKGFGGIVNGPSLDVIKTQKDYDKDMAVLRSGNTMKIQIKNFTAENLGL